MPEALCRVRRARAARHAATALRPSENAMSAPLTVCLTTYNEERNLEQCLTQLTAQTFKDFALVVVDNGSTDATVAIARKFAERDSRVAVRTNCFNVGPIQNFQRCYWLPQSEFMMLASANDWVESDYIETLMGVLADKRVAIAYSRVGAATSAVPKTYVHATGDDPLVRSASVMRDFLAGHVLYGIMRRAAIDWMAPMPYRMGADHIFVAEAALFGHIHCVDRELYHRMSHAGRTHRSMAWLCSDYGYRTIQDMPAFAGELGVMPPFLELLNGYFEMIDRARISNRDKHVLKAHCLAIIKSRFGAVMADETRELLDHAVGFLMHVTTNGTRIDEQLHASAILRALWVAAMAVPDLRVRIQGILQRLTPISMSELTA